MSTSRRLPVQERARATVEAIVEATSQLIDRAAAVSTNEVARRAGVSVGSLYQYFATKDSLLAAALRRELDALHEATLARGPWRTDEPLLDMGEQLIGGLIDSARGRRRGLGRLLVHARTVWRMRGTRLSLATHVAARQLEAREREVRVPPDHRHAAAFVLPALVLCAVDAAALAWPELLESPLFRAEVIALLGYRLLEADLVERHPTQRAAATAPPRSFGASHEHHDEHEPPRRRAALARRDALIDAAIELAGEVPWAEVTPRAIARRAGVPSSTFYGFFEGRDAVLRAAMARDGDRIATLVEASLSASESLEAETVARTAVSALLAGHRARAKAYGELLREDANPGTTRREAEILDRVERSIGAVLARHGGHGVSPERQTIAAFLLARVPAGVVHWALRERPELRDDPAFEAELAAVVAHYVMRSRSGAGPLSTPPG